MPSNLLVTPQAMPIIHSMECMCTFCSQVLNATNKRPGKEAHVAFQIPSKSLVKSVLKPCLFS